MLRATHQPSGPLAATRKAYRLVRKETVLGHLIDFGDNSRAHMTLDRDRFEIARVDPEPGFLERVRHSVFGRLTGTFALIRPGGGEPIATARQSARFAFTIAGGGADMVGRPPSVGRLMTVSDGAGRKLGDLGAEGWGAPTAFVSSLPDEVGDAREVFALWLFIKDASEGAFADA